MTNELITPNYISALNECVKQGDFCPRLSECKKQENDSFACVCKSGFRMTGNKSLACIGKYHNFLFVFFPFCYRRSKLPL